MVHNSNSLISPLLFQPYHWLPIVSLPVMTLSNSCLASGSWTLDHILPILEHPGHTKNGCKCPILECTWLGHSCPELWSCHGDTGSQNVPCNIFRALLHRAASGYQRDMCCILWWNGSHRSLLKIMEYLLPYLSTAAALESWLGLGSGRPHVPSQFSQVGHYIWSLAGDWMLNKNMRFCTLLRRTVFFSDGLSRLVFLVWEKRKSRKGHVSTKL